MALPRPRPPGAQLEQRASSGRTPLWRLLIGGGWFAVSMAGVPPSAAASPPPRTIFDVLRDVKKSILYLGEDGPEGPLASATGFVIDVGNVNYLVTARHVIVRPDGSRRDENMKAYFNLKTGAVGSRSIALVRAQTGCDWVMTPDPSIDIALTPIGINATTDDILRVPPEIWKPMADVPETTELLFIAYQPNAGYANRVAPVIRTGMLSRINDDKTFYMDGPAFPGNSGSPVFVRPVPARYLSNGNISVGPDPLAFSFVGVVGEYVPYIDSAVSPQTDRVRITFEENTGLTRVWSTDSIHALIGSPTFAAHVKELAVQGLLKSPGP